MLTVLCTSTLKRAAPALRGHNHQLRPQVIMSAAHQHHVLLCYRQEPTASAAALLHERVSSAVAVRCNSRPLLPCCITCDVSTEKLDNGWGCKPCQLGRYVQRH